MNTPKLLALAVVVALLAGCDEPASPAPSSPAESPAVPTKSLNDLNNNSYRYSLQADGLDICYRKATEHLGKETKVESILSYFAKGDSLKTSLGPAGEPKGALTTCKITYQDPADAKKLVYIDMDSTSGEFSAPGPVNISVAGDVDKFRLDDYLIPMTKVDPRPINDFLQQKKSWLDSYFSDYALTSVTLNAPGAFQDEHTFSVQVEGRLVSNSIIKTASATISADGKKVLEDSMKAKK